MGTGIAVGERNTGGGHFFAGCFCREISISIHIPGGHAIPSAVSLILNSRVFGPPELPPSPTVSVIEPVAFPTVSLMESAASEAVSLTVSAASFIDSETDILSLLVEFGPMACS